MAAVAVIIKCKTFMIESVGGKVMVPQVAAITDGAGYPHPGKEQEFQSLFDMMVHCETEDEEEMHAGFMHHLEGGE